MASMVRFLKEMGAAIRDPVARMADEVKAHGTSGVQESRAKKSMVLTFSVGGHRRASRMETWDAMYGTCRARRQAVKRREIAGPAFARSVWHCSSAEALRCAVRGRIHRQVRRRAESAHALMDFT
jgi:hypothetical protein